MTSTIRLIHRLGAALLVAALAVTFGPAQTAQRQNPPEYNEVVAASRIQDAAARLKEFERIKTAFPNGQMMMTIDAFISAAKIELAPTLDAVLGLQKTEIAAAKGPRKLSVLYAAGFAILEHPKVKEFDHARVLAAITQYGAALEKAATDPESFKDIPAEQHAPMKTYYVTGFGLALAKAHLNAGDSAKALAALEAYRKNGGATDAQYLYALAETRDAAGDAKEAFEAFLGAAIDNYEDSAARAKALYAKINGKADGFEAALESRLKALPYHPEPFAPPAGWKGKAVLAELFTGSECPPCVGADLGFDGLIESIPAQYLTILEYHLPIPRPDPMMNPATKKRQDVYGVNSTPTVVIDGTEKIIGGGSRGMAEGKFKQYKEQVLARVAEAAGAALKLRAALAGGIVKVDFEIDKPVSGAEVNVVLVQGEQTYKGSNGLAFHKLVVRDLAVIDPSVTKTTTFDLAASEKATDAYLTEFEKTYTRVPNFKWSVRHNAIARQGLKVALFVQDKVTKKVLNSVSADVK
jgi:tetratricopeptide (TPR) repeat protein